VHDTTQFSAYLSDRFYKNNAVLGLFSHKIQSTEVIVGGIQYLCYNFCFVPHEPTN
jgi:hypothetical protein